MDLATDVGRTDATERQRLLFVVNVAWFFVSHRLSLALSAQAAGYDVHVAAAPDDAEALATLRSHGITFHPIRITRSTFRVVDELRALSDLMRLYRSLRPSVVHHVTIKPMLYGSLAARLTSVSPVINAVSGMGYVFTSSGGRAGLRRRLVTLAYRWLFARPGTWVIVQNADDAAFLSDAKIVDPARCVLIRGSGVDLDRFAYLPPPATRPVLVVCPCRMLWDKGVGEFVEAARLLRSWDVDVRCALVGGLDAQNPAAVPEEYLQAAVADGVIEWWGHRRDMPEILSNCHIVCLPSYREGIPKALLEAAAAGRPVVTTDVPGCREAVDRGKTGLIVPPRDPRALATAIRCLVDDERIRLDYGQSAREKAVREFSVEGAAAATLAVYAKARTGQSG